MLLDYSEKWRKPSRFLILKLLIQTACVHSLLAVFGFNRVKWLLLQLVDFSKKSSVTVSAEEALVLRGNIKYPFKYIKKNNLPLSNCLSTSLLVWFLLKRKGIDTEIIIGTQFRGNSFKAHAWVELQNYPLNEGLKVREKYFTFAHNFIDQKQTFNS